LIISVTLGVTGIVLLSINMPNEEQRSQYCVLFYIALVLYGVILFTHWLAISDSETISIALSRLIIGICLYIAGFIVDFLSFPEYN
jgi:predicted membrane channel-forming protein YqfA (hemolysin III family)